MHERTRRDLLAGLGAAGGALAAGCLGDAGTDEDGQPDGREPGDTTRPARPVESGEFAAGCPDYVSTERVICWDAIESGSVPGFLEPSGRTLSVDSDIAFTLHNKRDAPLQSNFYDWQVHKRVDDDWFHVAPLSWPEPLMTVDPGETHTWTVGMEDGVVAAGQLVDRLTETSDIVLTGVGGGRYAFRARGRFADDQSETPIAFAATFDVEADPLPLTTTDVLQNVAVDGDVVRAESTRGEPDGGYEGGLVYDLERLDPPVVDAQSLITEQIVRRLPLRDAVALAVEHDADRVQIEEVNGAIPMFASNLAREIEYQGAYFSVVTRQPEA